jgi:hypothetical protein
MTDVTTTLPRSADSVAAARRLVDRHAGDLPLNDARTPA